MVATGSPSGFAAFGLPDGLTVNPSSGVISGTPMVATTASINLVFEYPDGSLLGSLNDNNASALIMTLLIKPKFPIVKTKAAANASATRADLNGEVQEDGGAIVSANAYYGTPDGGTDPNAWASVYPAGNAEGNFTVPMGNLGSWHDLPLPLPLFQCGGHHGCLVGPKHELHHQHLGCSRRGEQPTWKRNDRRNRFRRRIAKRRRFHRFGYRKQRTISAVDQGLDRRNEFFGSTPTNQVAFPRNKVPSPTQALRLRRTRI